MSIELVVPPNHLLLCHPLLLQSSIVPRIKVFSDESVLCIRWPKYWSFSFSISPSNEYWGLISFRIDWLDLLAVQETLKSLLQHHSSKASILWCSAFFKVQLSHPYMTTGKSIALTTWTFVGKVMSLLFSTLFSTLLLITFLSKSKHLFFFKERERGGGREGEREGGRKEERKVAQSCLTLWDPTGCSLPGSFIHGVWQARGWSGLPFPSPNKHLLISWLQSPLAVILEPKKIKSHCFHCFSIYLPWSDGTGCQVSFLNVEL